MRWLLTLLVLLFSIGCRSQSAPITNPFLAPDRVPPPSTGALQPGAAQPYYPGDPVPGATSVVPPSTSYPPPPSTYPPAVTPPPQTSPVSPPGGWNQPAPTGNVTPYGAQPTTGYAPASISAVESQVVSVLPDNQNLRFASVPANNSTDIIQVAAQQQSLPQQGYVYEPPIATQGFPQSQPLVQPPVQQPTAILPAATTLPVAASDGFRPQGSSRQTESSSGFQSPNIGPQEDSNLFGFDATYTWLRGQLQYFPEKGVWGVRYITIGGGLDQYGGIAVISNPDVLGGLPAGEHILVQGYMEVLDAGGGQFMPSYTIEGIQRQR